jgi:hypothetical protein
MGEDDTAVLAVDRLQDNGDFVDGDDEDVTLAVHGWSPLAADD